MAKSVVENEKSVVSFGEGRCGAVLERVRQRSAGEERCRVEEKCCRLQECRVNCGEVLYQVLKMSRKSVGEEKRSPGKGSC